MRQKKIYVIYYIFQAAQNTNKSEDEEMYLNNVR